MPKGIKGFQKGYKPIWSKKSRNKASKTHKRIGTKPPSWLGKKGEKSGAWKGGLSEINNRIRGSTEYTLWRKSIFERDNYTCIWCGHVGSGLVADHIIPFSLYPELRFAIDNGRTLCRSCHQKTDTFGWKLLKKKKKYNE